MITMQHQERSAHTLNSYLLDWGSELPLQDLTESIYATDSQAKAV